MTQQPHPEDHIIKLGQTAKKQNRKRPLPVPLRLVLGLALLITVGTLLLLLPGITTRPITFSDALFTTTSAASVTGLTVLTTSTDFTFLGQIVLLGLIQLGGVGYMVLVAVALQLVGRRVSLLDRLAVSTSLGLDKPASILNLLRQVVVGILLIEGVGALLLYLHWRVSGIVAPENAAFYAIFHAVSAFCNAGFDLFVGLPQYPRGIPGDNLTLLIMGGLIGNRSSGRHTRSAVAAAAAQAANLTHAPDADCYFRANAGGLDWAVCGRNAGRRGAGISTA